MKKSERLDIKNLVLDLKKIVGEPYVSDDIYDRVSYARDPMPYDIEDKNIPYAVVRPGTTEEVSKLMAYLNKRKIPVYSHGSGTSLGGIPGRRRSSVIIATGWV
jgi:FAD/FMN-containing dehydrogenase